MTRPDDRQTGERSRVARSVRRVSGTGRFIVLIATGLLLASCTSGGPDRSGLSAILTPDQQTQATPDTQPESGTEATAVASPRPSGVPKPRPQSGAASPSLETALVPADSQTAPAAPTTEQVAAKAEEPAPTPLSLFARLTAPRTTQVARQNPTPAPAENTQNTASQSDESLNAATESATPPKKPGGIFANLFQNRSSAINRRDTQRSGVKTTNNSSRARLGWNTAALPGVRSKKDLFGTDIDEVLELDEGVKLASVTNRARRGAHGLLLQRPDVKVGCFPPQLVRLIKQVERRFGRKAIITSGFRSRAYNRMIRGARNSMHIHCKAADIQVQGVSKARLARYLRSLPGRGGVGTYCHTKSVHLDIGKKRDWNRRCRRRRTRKS